MRSSRCCRPCPASRGRRGVRPWLFLSLDMRARSAAWYGTKNGSFPYADVDYRSQRSCLIETTAMARLLQLPVTATFDAAEPWRVNLGAAFQDLVPQAVDGEPAPRGSLSGVRLGPVGVFTVSGTPQ